MNHLVTPALAATLILAACPVTAQTATGSLESVKTLNICGGKRGLSYDRYANNLSNLLKTGFRIEAPVTETDGGPDSIERIQLGSCDVGFAQGDTVLAKQPPLDLLGQIGQECGFFVVHKDGKVNDDDDFEDAKLAPILAVGGEGSGAAWSWRYVVELDDDHANTVLDYSAGATALTKLLAKQVDAVLVFTDPTKIAQTAIGKAVEENDQLEWLDFEDSSMNNDLPSGEPVYTFEDIEVPGQWSDVETICVGLFVVASRTMDPKVKESLAQIILANPRGVTQ